MDTAGPAWVGLAMYYFGVAGVAVWGDTLSRRLCLINIYLSEYIFMGKFM